MIGICNLRNYIVFIYEQRNFDHVLGVVSQTTVSGGNRTHDPHPGLYIQSANKSHAAFMTIYGHHQSFSNVEVVVFRIQLKDSYFHCHSFSFLNLKYARLFKFS